MRLFVSVDLPDAIRHCIQNIFPLNLASAREVPLHQLHLTLRFIGEVDPPKFKEIQSALQEISSKNFSLALKGIGVFPYPKRPRVLWLGLTHVPDLLNLQAQVEKTLQSLGVPGEKRAFSPHLTLARFKFGQPKEVEAFLQKHEAFQSPEWEVREFHLYSSQLNPKGAIHTIEQTYELR